jgi:hypothetical protein
MKRLARHFVRLFSPKIPLTVLDDVYSFCKIARILRTPENCAKHFAGKYDVTTCKKAIAHLYNCGMMGAYTFGPDIEAHSYMREYILNTLPGINVQSKKSCLHALYKICPILRDCSKLYFSSFIVKNAGTKKIWTLR